MARPTGVEERPDGAVADSVSVVVRDPSGKVQSRDAVRNVHRFTGDLVQRMDVEGWARRSGAPPPRDPARTGRSRSARRPCDAAG